MPAAVAMNTHFSHISCRISSAEPRIEAGVEQRRGDGLDPRRTGAVEFAEAQRMPIIEVDDGAVGAEGRGDGALPAEHALGARSVRRAGRCAACRSGAAESPSPGRPPWRMTPSRPRGRRLCSSAPRGRTAPPGLPAAQSAAKRRWKSPTGLRMISPCFASSAARRGRTRNVTSRPACSRRPPK